MVDVAAVGALLAPALPYLVRSADRAANQAADALSGAAGDFAQRVWAKLGGRMSERPAAREAIADVVAAPDDEDARFVLVRQLGKLLDADPDLAAEIEGLMDEATRAGVEIHVVGDRNVMITDATLTNSSIISGDASTRAGS